MRPEEECWEAGDCLARCYRRCCYSHYSGCLLKRTLCRAAEGRCVHSRSRAHPQALRIVGEGIGGGGGIKSIV